MHTVSDYNANLIMKHAFLNFMIFVISVMVLTMFSIDIFRINCLDFRYLIAIMLALLAVKISIYLT